MRINSYTNVFNLQIFLGQTIGYAVMTGSLQLNNTHGAEMEFQPSNLVMRLQEMNFDGQTVHSIYIHSC